MQNSDPFQSRRHQRESSQASSGSAGPPSPYAIKASSSNLPTVAQRQSMNSTISKDLTRGQDARNAALLAEFGKKNNKRLAASSQAREGSTKLSLLQNTPEWSPEEDALLIELRSVGMNWEDISKRIRWKSERDCQLRHEDLFNEPDGENVEYRDVSTLSPRFVSNRTGRSGDSETQVPEQLDEPSERLLRMSNLAVQLESQGKYDEAESVNRQTVSLSEKQLGRSHPFTLESVNIFARFLESRGRSYEAEAIFHQANLYKEKESSNSAERIIVMADGKVLYQRSQFKDSIDDEVARPAATKGKSIQIISGKPVPKVAGHRERLAMLLAPKRV